MSRMWLKILAVVLITVLIAIAFAALQINQWFEAGSTATREADRQIRAGIVVGMTREEVLTYLQSIGATIERIGGMEDRVLATVDQRGISPGPLTFACNPDIRIRVTFDSQDRVEDITLSRICL
jgi:hypothetical protein